MIRSCMAAMAMFLLAGSPALADDAQRRTYLDEKSMDLIQEAVFEVVVLKPAKDSLSYEKPLPFDLLPYAVRTDKYYSIGTAFAIGPDQFVSAAHVMNLDEESQYTEVMLRDTKGALFAIDKITKFSDHRDFVIFSLKDKKAGRYFEVNRKPKLNQTVFAVGNALGQGVVIRDGLYTSNTKEEVDGAWDWMRFSAAASPGNSGGPLLDRDGKVVGIVLRKSSNENLNYALPLAEALDAKANTASSYKKAAYRLDIMDMTKMGTYKKEIALPKSYGELKRELVADFNRFSDRLLKDLLAEYKGDIFPNGDGSIQMLHSTYSAVFPHMIMKGEDGNWDAFYAQETKRADLGKNGYLTYGNMKNSLYLYIQKPDDISLKTFYSDSKRFMDLVLKGIYFNRQVASEKIKITSFGKAVEDYRHTDAWGRTWFVRTWLMEYTDGKIITFSLPVPNGFITIMKAGQTGTVDSGYLPDLKVYADFAYLSYYGTLKQWQEFLAMKDAVPAAFSAIDLTFSKKELQFRSKRLSFSYTPEVMKITENSDASLLFSYFRDGNKVVWDVAGVTMGEDKNNRTVFTVYRNMKPAKELRDSYRSDWENIVGRKFPYNSSAYFKEGQTIIQTVHAKDGDPKNITGKTSVLYTISMNVEGSVDQKDLEARLAKIDAALNVAE